MDYTNDNPSQFRTLSQEEILNTRAVTSKKKYRPKIAHNINASNILDDSNLLNNSSFVDDFETPNK